MFNLDLDLDDEPVVVRSEAHKTKHVLFVILVCTGMAHLVMTTFQVPGISYIRVFLVGAVFVAVGLLVKMGHEKLVPLSIGAALFSAFSSLLEYMISGSNFLASALVSFDVMIIFYVLRYIRLKDLPFPDGDHKTAEQLAQETAKNS